MTVIGHRPLRSIVLCVTFVIVAASAAFAQSQVRVTRDRATIWQRDSPVVAAIVMQGTVLEVTERQGDWYVVVLPSGTTAAGTLGRIAVSQVELVEGGRPVPQRSADMSSDRPAARPAVKSHPVEFFGFGHVGYQRWLANNSFDAVLGSSSLPMFGGGLQIRFTHIFLEAAAERLEKTGERVFVNDGDVFKLGIRDTVRVVPFSLTAGYRQSNAKMTGYAGGGVGRLDYRETSDFSDPDENVAARFSSYHVLAGIEFASLQWLRTALEVQYTTVPDALGSSGVAAAFDEHNLGGTEIRLKILIGR